MIYILTNSLKRNEEAYKTSLKLAIAAGDGLIDISSPLFELVKYYKNKVAKLKTELKGLK